MTGPAAVVFDFDGVLADSEPLHFRVFRRVLAEAGVELTERAYYERYLGFEDEGAFEAVSRDHVRTWTADDIARLIARKAELMPALLAGDGVLFPGAADCVRACAARAPLAIASGAQRGEIELVLRAARLDFLFPVVVASGDTRKGKPDPAPYVKAVELLKRATRLPMATPMHRIVAVEDSHWGLASARAAGLRSVAVSTSYPADDLRDHADLVVDAISGVTWTLLAGLVDA